MFTKEIVEIMMAAIGDIIHTEKNIDVLEKKILEHIGKRTTEIMKSRLHQEDCEGPASIVKGYQTLKLEGYHG